MLEKLLYSALASLVLGSPKSCFLAPFLQRYIYRLHYMHVVRVIKQEELYDQFISGILSGNAQRPDCRHPPEIKRRRTTRGDVYTHIYRTSLPGGGGGGGGDNDDVMETGIGIEHA